ncbi:MAG TPA: tetratricopeptide repeat protein, partial [Candidatus Binataceae bacterium]|nr:tetratricopeptide repeat protein [Candidatus Binataceae bacterium]
FSRCIEAEPNAWIWHNALGMSRFGRGDLDGARREFEQARNLDPNEAGNLYMSSLLYERLGDWRKAEDAIRARMKLLAHPSSGGYAELAFAADAAGDSAEAEAALREAAALPDGATIAPLARAQIRFRHGDTKAAAELLDPLLNHPPVNAQSLVALATELSAEKRYADALTAYRMAERIDPGYPGLHVRIAYLLRGLQQDREARAECAVELADAPNDPGARALWKALNGSGGER